MSTSPLTPAEIRLAKIDEEIRTLSLERDEIATALSVLSRYSERVKVSENLHDDFEAEPKKKTPPHDGRNRKDVTGPPRPDGIPTIWEMVELVIADAEDRQASTDEMLAKIGSLWWPGVVRNQIAPQVYRFVKDGRLEQVDKGVFALPRESAPAAAEKPKAEHAASMFGSLNPSQAQ